MGFLAFLLVFGVALLVIAGLVAFAALVHRDTDDDYTPINELLK